MGEKKKARKALRTTGKKPVIGARGSKSQKPAAGKGKGKTK